MKSLLLYNLGKGIRNPEELLDILEGMTNGSPRIIRSDEAQKGFDNLHKNTQARLLYVALDLLKLVANADSPDARNSHSVLVAKDLLRLYDKIKG